MTPPRPDLRKKIMQDFGFYLVMTNPAAGYAACARNWAVVRAVCASPDPEAAIRSLLAVAKSAKAATAP